MDIIKISLLGVCGVMLGFFLKGTKPEYAVFVTVGIGIMILGLAAGKIEYIFSAVQEYAEMRGIRQRQDRSSCSVSCLLWSSVFLC